jgi:hypothetical protein
MNVWRSVRRWIKGKKHIIAEEQQEQNVTELNVTVKQNIDNTIKIMLTHACITILHNRSIVEMKKMCEHRFTSLITIRVNDTIFG